MTHSKRLKETPWQRRILGMFLATPRLEINGEEPLDERLATDRFNAEGPPEDLGRVIHHICGRDHTPGGQVLLGVLTCFYAIGVYGSDEIAAALAKNPNADSLHRIAFQNREPEVVLRRFRRDNRAALENCLSGVLKEVWPGTSNCDVEIEANRRVRNAIQADSFALDF